MKKVSEEVYCRINNDIYNIEGDRWWHQDFSLNLIRTFINPFRVDYAKKVLAQFNMNSENINALEIGCGGGILSKR